MSVSKVFASAVVCGMVLTSVSDSFGGFISDNFEGDLSQWTGINGGGHTGSIVADPLSSGRGNVLTFTDVRAGGDILTVDSITMTGTFAITFDYLGLANQNSTPGDFGGFLGASQDLTPDNNVEGVDVVWLAGTKDGYAGVPGLVSLLIDDGQWHTYTIQSSDIGMTSFHLMLEDFRFSDGGSGDVFFDNIRISEVSSVPEPASLTLLGLGALGFVGAARRRQAV